MQQSLRDSIYFDTIITVGGLILSGAYQIQTIELFSWSSRSFLGAWVHLHSATSALGV
jgi:hypothetical protein